MGLVHVPPEKTIQRTPYYMNTAKILKKKTQGPKNRHTSQSNMKGAQRFWRSSVDERKIERKLVDRVDRKAS